MVEVNLPDASMLDRSVIGETQKIGDDVRGAILNPRQQR
jgi:hypothetical protein